MELVAKKKFMDAEIRVYRHEGRIWMPAHDIERALGLPKEAFGIMVHNEAVRKPGEKVPVAIQRAERESREHWGEEAMLFGRRNKRTYVDKKSGQSVEREDVDGLNWKLTCEGARRFALKSLAAPGREFIFWVDALQAETANS